MTAYTNPLKTRLADGEVVLGMSVRLTRSPDIARIAKTSGHDFLFIDAQHSIFNVETLSNIAQTALAIGIAPLVRVQGIDDPDVSLLLDNGVTGIVYPDINNADEARRAVDVCKFAPLGKRSVTGGYPMFDFAPVPLSEAIPALNDATLLVAMIETVEGLENVEEIAAVPGIDVIHVGTNDLLVNMGKAGRFDDPEIVAAQARVNAACAANGKVAGCGGNRDVTRQAAAVAKGARFFTTQTDIAFLAAAAKDWTTRLREMVERA
ncbi:HpcH/HpaI aldolase family protein [Roseitranquillus sediminis]|uniref:HpcH/HpaI aldolase family protein n=1 Tax=Roseitranquillus sediminis TaxID=2809051 RepID=UPI001D0C8D76|nr:aldolase/citrate lyase family protein [Roseitranquillus sediminis]MBM9592992.1 hypothetical protein [Roseitranquillus sediminis]